LDAIKWPAQTETEFLASNATRLPNIDKAYYDGLKLPFDPEKLSREFNELGKSVTRQLGADDALGHILLATIEQYQTVISLLTHRGDQQFGRFSKTLYGSPRDKITGDNQTLLDLGQRLCQLFSLPAAQQLHQSYPKNISADAAVSQLQKRMDRYFGAGTVRVEISDDIVSDAAAGGDRIKINSRALFSDLDLKVLEVHEGWV